MNQRKLKKKKYKGAEERETAGEEEEEEADDGQEEAGKERGRRYLMSAANEIHIVAIQEFGNDVSSWN